MSVASTGRLWFDVETNNRTTLSLLNYGRSRLWFDVETNNRTTKIPAIYGHQPLWFDVETNNRTTDKQLTTGVEGCGLMQKLIIEQR